MQRNTLDTNCLLRLLVRDSESEFQKVVAIVSQKNTRFFVPTAAVCEAVYVLSRFYKLGRDEIRYALNTLLLNPVFELDHATIFQSLTTYTRFTGLSFTDCILAIEAQNKKTGVLVTLDKDLARKLPHLVVGL